MQFLVVLLLIVGVIVAMVAGLLGLSYALGVHLYSREGTRAKPGDPDPCAQCGADYDWYEALPAWKKQAITAWWWANRMACASKGCN